MRTRLRIAPLGSGKWGVQRRQLFCWETITYDQYHPWADAEAEGMIMTFDSREAAVAWAVKVFAGHGLLEILV